MNTAQAVSPGATLSLADRATAAAHPSAPARRPYVLICLTFVVALTIEAIVAWLCVTGMMTLAPDEPETAGAAALACEASVSVMAFWISRPLPSLIRIAMVALLVPLMAVADVGVATKLSAAHVRHRAETAVARVAVDGLSGSTTLWEADLADARRALAVLDASVERRETSAQMRSARDLRAEQAAERAALAVRIDRDTARLETIARQRTDATATRVTGEAKDSPALFVAEALAVPNPERVIYVLVIVVSLTLPLVKILMWSIASVSVGARRVRPPAIMGVAVAEPVPPPEAAPAEPIVAQPEKPRKAPAKRPAAVRRRSADPESAAPESQAIPINPPRRNGEAPRPQPVPLRTRL